MKIYHETKKRSALFLGIFDNTFQSIQRADYQKNGDNLENLCYLRTEN
jgi:hypothetical protein